MKEVQLATMQARLDELERRDAKVAAQKAKKKERRKNQKAKKAAAAAEAEAASAQNGGDAGAGSRDRPAEAAAEARLESFKQAVAAVTDEAETRIAQRKVAALENIYLKPSLGPDNLGRGLNVLMKVPPASVAAQMTPDQLVAVLDGCQGCATKRDEAVQLLLSPHDPKVTYSGPFAGQLSGMDTG